MKWRGCWATAQITGLAFSTFVWLLVQALIGPWLAAIVVSVWIVSACRNRRLGLWWRFNARPATPYEAAPILAALVPIEAMRGRRQPRVWIGTSINRRAVALPSASTLVIGQDLPRCLEQDPLAGDELCAVVSHASGLLPVRSSLMVTAVEAYCLPWMVAEFITHHAARVLRRLPLTATAWRIRWLIFAVALAQSVQAGRWPAAIGVGVIATLTGTTGILRRRWKLRMLALGDDQTIRDGYATVLSDMIRTPHPTAHQALRVERLRRAAAGRTNQAGSASAEAVIRSGRGQSPAGAQHEECE